MINKIIIKKRATSDRNKGLLIAMAASLVLIILATYNVSVLRFELQGVITGVSAVHDETGVKSTVTVRLDSGEQVLASMPPNLEIRAGVKARVMEGLSIFGRKSYEIVTYNE